ncbi:MAG: L,D-transpeptidase [Hyphomicrobiaceae bacterium]
MSVTSTKSNSFTSKAFAARPTGIIATVGLLAGFAPLALPAAGVVVGAGVFTAASATPAAAQWYEEDTYRRRSNRGYRRYGRRYDDYDSYYDRQRRRRAGWDRDRWDEDDDDDDEYDRYDRYESRRYSSPRTKNNSVRSGGPRPAVLAKAPPRVTFRNSYKPGSIIIDQSSRKLYLILSNRSAYRYPISVGREGFSWSGKENVSRIAAWPDWHPPKEMRARDPKLPVKMTGGINNPLGAKAIYLGKTLYRIHGTNNPNSIGRAASSGCFRMMNSHVMHLASRVGVGTEVQVLKRLPKSAVATN